MDNIIHNNIENYVQSNRKMEHTSTDSIENNCIILSKVKLLLKTFFNNYTHNRDHLGAQF